MLHEVVVGLLAPLIGHEFLAACGLQESASPLDDVADILRRQLLDLVIYQPLVSLVDAKYLDPIVYSGAGDRTYGGIHARRISARGEYADGSDIAAACDRFVHIALLKSF